jgi:NTE family protein
MARVKRTGRAKATGNGKTALFLGGGAPNFTLMSGALLALHEKGIRFDIVSMAGAGAVVVLMYLVPKEMTPEQSLENTVNFGIADEIYRFFPVNYKAFAKWGPNADAFNRYWFSLPMVQEAAHQLGKNRMEKLRGDFILMLGAMMCPSDLSPGATGLSEHPAFIDSLIDFERLPKIRQNIELNAFRLRDRKVVDFTKKEITPDHLRAALSFPFIYPPYKIGDEYYYEGAAFQCINPSRVPAKEIDYFVVLQPMTANQIRAPHNLWDAYSQSVMMPVAALAQYGTAAVEHIARPEHMDAIIDGAIQSLERGSNNSMSDMIDGLDKTGDLRKLIENALTCAEEFNMAETSKASSECVPLSMIFPKIKDRWYEADFSITEDKLPFVFDWSRSNLEYLGDVGYVTGEDLAHDLFEDDHPVVRSA